MPKFIPSHLSSYPLVYKERIIPVIILSVRGGRVAAGPKLPGGMSEDDYRSLSRHLQRVSLTINSKQNLSFFTGRKDHYVCLIVSIYVNFKFLDWILRLMLSAWEGYTKVTCIRALNDLTWSENSHRKSVTISSRQTDQQTCSWCVYEWVEPACLWVGGTRMSMSGCR